MGIMVANMWKLMQFLTNTQKHFQIHIAIKSLCTMKISWFKLNEKVRVHVHHSKITLNRHFFETKPCFFDFVPKPTLLVNFSVYFDFLKFFKPKKTVGLNRRFCFRFSKMPFSDLDGFSVFCQKPTVSKLKFWIWKLQKVSVFDSNRNHLKYEIWMIH